MSTSIGIPQTIINTVNTVQITSFLNKIEEGRIEIHYITMLEDGSPYQRGNITIESIRSKDIDGNEVIDSSPIKAMYEELDTIIATGKTFEQASAELLYSKVLSKLNLI